MTAPALPARWKATAKQLALADRLAYRLILQAPWPMAPDTIDEDNALAALLKADPKDSDIEARVRAFTDALQGADPDLAKIWDELYGDILVHHEDATYLLGLAIGARLGPAALQAPADIGAARLQASRRTTQRQQPRKK